MKGPIRIGDIGGSGIRRADVYALNDIRNLKEMTVQEIQSLKKPEEIIFFFVDDLPKETSHIAYAVAGVIEERNLVVRAPNFPLLNGFELGKHTTQASGGKWTKVYNDMEAAAAGMALFSPVDYFLAITVSSGIGIRLVQKKKIICASEGGHIKIDLSPFAPLCGCGKRGCAEAIVSGDAIKRRVIAETAVRGIKIPENMHPCAFLDKSYENGDDWALQIYEMFIAGISLFLAEIGLIFHMPAVIWKGVFIENAFKLAAIKDLIREEVWRKTSILFKEKMDFYLSQELAEDFLKAKPPRDADALIGAAFLSGMRRR